MNSIRTVSVQQDTITPTIISFVVIFALLFYTSSFLYLHYLTNVNIDFKVYMNAAKYMLQGSNPYTVTNFFNPTWILSIFLLFVNLPIQYSYSLWFVFSFFGYWLLGYKLKSHPITILAALLSFPVLQGIIWGQLDWFVLLGMFLPKPIGFLLLATKPQITTGILLLWIYEERKNLLKLLLPTIVCTILSVILYGFLFVDIQTSLVTNTSIWPWGIVIGIILMLKKQHFVASAFFSPFLSIQSWGNILFAIKPKYAIMLSVASWILWSYTI